jgi:hypothetical protein
MTILRTILEVAFKDDPALLEKITSMEEITPLGVADLLTEEYLVFDKYDSYDLERAIPTTIVHKILEAFVSESLEGWRDRFLASKQTYVRQEFLLDGEPLTEGQKRRMRNAALALYETYGTKSNKAPIVTSFDFPSSSGHGSFTIQRNGKQHYQYYVEKGKLICCNHACNWEDEYYDLTRWAK